MKNTDKTAHPGRKPEVRRTAARPSKKVDTGHGIPSWNKFINILIISLILALTIFVYSSSLNHSLVSMDDVHYITYNQDIQKLSSTNLHNMFRHHYVSNFQPLTIFTYALEYTSTGNKSTFIYHFDNLLLHLLNTILVFWLVFLVSGKKRWVAAIATAFFALHPLRVESVTWVSERKDVLYSFFFLLALILYHFYLKLVAVSATEQGNRDGKKWKIIWKYLLITLMFTLSALSKSAAVVLPVIFILIDFLYKRKLSIWLFLEKIPWFLISILFGVLALKSQGNAMQAATAPAMTLVQHLLMINQSFWRYIYMSFIPVNLSIYHPYPQDVTHLPAIYYICLVLTVVFTGGLLYSLKFTRIIVFGALFFIINMVLVMQFILVGGTVISERYTYMPHIGLFFVFGWYVQQYSLKLKTRVPSSTYIIAAVLVFVLVLFSIGTFNRNKVWRDSGTLWSDVVEKYPHHTIGYFNLGIFYRQNGDMDRALEVFKRAVTDQPKDEGCRLELANIYFYRHQDSLAALEYSRILEINPMNTNAHMNRGGIYSRIGRYKEALADLDFVLDRSPDNPVALMNRAITHNRLNNYEKAIIDYSNYLKIKPDFDGAYSDRGAMYQSLKKYPEALRDYSKAIQLKPEGAGYYLNRSYLYKDMGDKTKASDDVQAAIKLGAKIDENYLRYLGLK